MTLWTGDLRSGQVSKGEEKATTNNPSPGFGGGTVSGRLSPGALFRCVPSDQGPGRHETVGSGGSTWNTPSRSPDRSIRTPRCTSV